MAKKISGIAIFPRLSENDVFYWPQELEKFDGVTVPLRWNHDQSDEAIIGEATFQYDKENRQVLYNAEITNEEISKEVDKGFYKVSIGAAVEKEDWICHKDGQCAAAPILKKPEELSIVANPGIPESSLNIIESVVHPTTKIDAISPVTVKESTKNKLENITSSSTEPKTDIHMAETVKECANTEVQTPEVAKEEEQSCPVGQKWDGEKCVPVEDAPKEDAPVDAPQKDVTVNVNVPESKQLDVDAIKSELKADVLAEMKKEWTPKASVKEGADIPDWKAKEAQWTPERVIEGLRNGRVTMTINKEDWIAERTQSMVTEAVSTSGTISGVKLTKDVIIIPGSNTFEPVRELGQFEVIEQGKDTAKFWTLDVAAFGAITESTSTDITASTHNLTAIDVTTATRGLRQTVLKSEMEDFPPKFIEKLKETMRLAAIKDEHNLIVQTIADTNSDFNNGTTVLTAGWPAHISGTDGSFVDSTVTEDAVGEFNKEGISTARRYLQERGHNPVTERVVAIISPRAYDSLINDADIARYIQQGDSSITTLGQLSKYFGIEIMVSNELRVENNSYRNVVVVKGKAFALASKREMELEMDKEIAGQYVNIVASHRIGVEELDKTAYVIVSSKQD